MFAEERQKTCLIRAYDRNTGEFVRHLGGNYALRAAEMLKFWWQTKTVLRRKGNSPWKNYDGFVNRIMSAFIGCP